MMMLKAMSNIPRFSTVLLLEIGVDKISYCPSTGNMFDFQI
jgi:hypothetical protein